MIKNELLNIEKLVKKADKGKNIITDFSLTVFEGDKICLDGKSGSGKSTILKSISMLEKIDSGCITFKGTNVVNLNIPEYRVKVNYIPQKPVFFEGTVEENIKKVFDFAINHKKKYDQRKVIEYFSRFGKPSDFIKNSITNLSGGEAQLVSFIRAIQLDPEVFLFDEPTSALDYESTLIFENILDELTQSLLKAYIWITHNKEQMKRVSNRTITL